jgi:hypothetical protein
MIWLMPLMLIGLGLVACLGLFLSLKRDLRMQAHEAQQRLESMIERLREAGAVGMQREEIPAALYVPARSGINLNWRPQALRLLRRGEDVSHIAAALGVPRCEVELLIRVQEFSAGRGAASRGDGEPAPV